MGKLLIRAEGSATIGLGHLFRSSALAEMLKEYFEIHFFINSEAPAAVREVLEKHYKVTILDDNDSLPALLGKHDAVVLDGYLYDSPLQQKMRANSAGLVIIDDVHDKHYHADLIINQAIGISETDYSKEEYSVLLKGPAYTIVRKEFRLLKKRLRNAVPEKVFVCFGGSDTQNYTLIVLEILEEVFIGSEIIVVTGPAYAHLSELQRFSASAKRTIHLYHNIEAGKLATLIESCDLAIVPSSTILMETLSVGTPALSGYYTSNQRDIALGYLEAGLIYGGIDFTKKTELRKAIDQALSSNLKEKEETISRFFDGRSPSRILKEFINLFFPVHGGIRKASGKDSGLLFEWANDPVSRHNAINTKVIERAEHEAWFSRRLQDPGTHILIFSFNNMPVGQIRFEEREETIVISYAVAPVHRGLGFGDIVVKAGIEWFRNHVQSVKPFEAIVKDINPASSHIFEKNNFCKLRTFTQEGQQFFEFRLPAN